MKYRVNFFDKASDETRSIVVEASDEDEAENKAEQRANAENWPSSFRIGDAEEIED